MVDGPGASVFQLDKPFAKVSDCLRSAMASDCDLKTTHLQHRFACINRCLRARPHSTLVSHWRNVGRELPESAPVQVSNYSLRLMHMPSTGSSLPPWTRRHSESGNVRWNPFLISSISTRIPLLYTREGVTACRCRDAPHDGSVPHVDYNARAKASQLTANQTYQHVISAATPATQTVATKDINFREEVGMTRQAISVANRHKTENTTIPKKYQPICPDD